MTKVQDAIEHDKAAADDALARADVRELYAVFQRSQERISALETVMTGLMEHYAGTKEMPRFQPTNENAIAAIERVAMEAIALAREVVKTSMAQPLAPAAVDRSATDPGKTSTRDKDLS